MTEPAARAEPPGQRPAAGAEPSEQRPAAGAEPSEQRPAAVEATAHSPRFMPWALGIFALALMLRLAHLLALRASPFLEVTLGDAATYDAWARRLAGGDWLGHEVFFQAPLYPYFLGALYATLGDAPLVVRGVQCVLSALACALVGSAGARLFSRGAGIAAGLLLATYAPSIFLDALLQKSVLDLLFVSLALWLVARLSRAPGGGLAFALGLAIGALALARENGLILAGVLAPWLLLLPSVGRRRRVALAALFVAGLGVVLAPVAVRNWWLGGEIHLTTSQLGVNLYIGNHPGAPGGFEPVVPGHGVEQERRDAQELAERAVGRPLSPGEASAYWTHRALDYVRSEPGAWLRLMGRKLGLLVSTVELVDAEDQYAMAEYSAVLRATGRLGHFGVLLPLAVVGAFVVWPRRRELWWLYAGIAAYAATLLVFYLVSRYRYPLVPLLALLAGAGLTGAPGWAATRPRRDVLLALAVAGVLAVLSNGLSAMPKERMQAVTYANLGSFFHEKGELERAAHHFERALALDPGLDGVANDLARTWYELGRPAQAIALYEKGLAAAPDDARLHRNLARILRAQGAREPALEHFRRAVELAPDDGETRGELVELELELAGGDLGRGDTAAALAHYRAALAARPESAAALWGAAWILATQPDASLGDPAQAALLAERAAALTPQPTPATLEAWAAAEAAGGRFDSARARAGEAAARLATEGRPVPTRLDEALARYARGERLRLRAPESER